MRLHDVHQGVVRNKKRKRLGRGPGSGQGKTAGRGHKGQASRAGWSIHPAFQGGAMPLVRRVPKRGFHNAFAPTVLIVNVGDLERCFQAGEEVTVERLKKSPLVGHRFDQIKILGDGQLTKALTVTAHRFSRSAVEKIEKAGGRVVRMTGGAAASDAAPQSGKGTPSGKAKPSGKKNSPKRAKKGSATGSQQEG
jgi:large subunit ribosomal protein L15